MHVVAFLPGIFSPVKRDIIKIFIRETKSTSSACVMFA
jgi:hypothetical protein